jgi:putative tryptophan/tyrosine transport system substrate-binding protein
VRRIGVLMGWSESDPVFRGWEVTFAEELGRLGWVDGRNARIEQRWTDANVDRAGMFAKELVNLQPDVILARTTPVTAALQRETRTIPIIFAGISDPVGAGFVASLSRPAGNLTGFINLEAAMGGKWLELLKELAPRIKRAAIMFNPDTAPGAGSYFLPSFETAAQSLKIEPIFLRVRSDAEIETAINSLGGEQAGLVLESDSFLGVHSKTISSLAVRNGVPAIMDVAKFAKEGGLMSYGASFTDVFRRAAGHVDRVLRGTKPADLPVEVPIKFEMVINLKTAKALGLSVPNTLLVSANEVIE